MIYGSNLNPKEKTRISYCAETKLFLLFNPYTQNDSNDMIKINKTALKETT